MLLVSTSIFLVSTKISGIIVERIEQFFSNNFLKSLIFTEISIFLMESLKKKQAIRAKEMALEKMQSKDFTSARKFAAKAQQLCNGIDKIEQMIMVCDVHCSAADRGLDDDKDWYKILGVDPTADEASVRRQCHRMALSLHPDKNRFPGAADAFHMVLEAKAVLTDNERRRLYDSACKAKALGSWNDGFARFQNSYKPRKRTSKKNVAASEAAARRVLGDDEVEIVRTVKRSKPSGSFSLDGKEAVTKGKRTARSAPKPKETQAKAAIEIAPNSKILEYSDGEFNDFEQERSKKCFSAGQVWAVYDTLDAMPRFYALINDIVSEDFKLQITWLEPLPNNEDEKKWLHQGLPACFGKFRLGHSETIEDHAIFSHLVRWKRSADSSNIYEICPRKGEVWALFKKWDIDWYKDPESHRVYEFELVEVVSDYYGGFGVTIAFLSKMKGFSSSFSRIIGKGVDWEVIQVKNRFRFSHKIPSFQVTSNDGTNGVKNFFELDPACLPSDLSCTS